MIELRDIFYIAGLLDGEGSFLFRKNTPIIQMGTIDLDLILNYKNKIKSKVIIQKEIRARPYKDFYRLDICGSTAISWMMTLYPLLCKRRKLQIKRVIKIWKTRQVFNINKIYCNNGHILSRDNLYIEMSGARRCRRCKADRARERKYAS